MNKPQVPQEVPVPITFKSTKTPKGQIKALQARAHETARNNGFWDKGQDNILAKLMLCVTELAEVAESYRKGEIKIDEHCPEFTNLSIELADTVIRVMDIAEYSEVNLEAAILAKMEYNLTRPYRHGKKY